MKKPCLELAFVSLLLQLPRFSLLLLLLAICLAPGAEGNKRWPCGQKFTSTGTANMSSWSLNGGTKTLEGIIRVLGWTYVSVTYDQVSIILSWLLLHTFITSTCSIVYMSTATSAYEYYDRCHHHQLAVETLVSDLHTLSIYTIVYDDLDTFLNVTATTMPQQKSDDDHVHGAFLVLGSYHFVLQVFGQIADMSGTDSRSFVLTTEWEWLTVVHEENIQNFSEVAQLYEQLVVLVQQRTGNQTVWTVNRLQQVRALRFVKTLSREPTLDLVRHDLLPEQTHHGLWGRHLTIVMKEWSNMLWSTEENGQTVYHGLIFDMVNELSLHLNFSYTLIKSPDDSWGQKLENGQWDGPIGMLTRKEADLAAGYFTITGDRSLETDPTTPYMFDNSVVVFRKKATTTENWKFFLHPFQSPLYATIGGCFAGVLLLLILMENRYHVEDGRQTAFFGIATNFFKVLAAVFEILLAGLISRPSERQGASRSARVLVVSWLILGVLLSSLYSSKLTSTLATNDLGLPFNSLAQLQAQDIYTWGIPAGTSLHSMLKSSKLKEYQTYYQKTLQFAEHDPEVLSPDVEVHKAKVLNENYAVFLGSSSTAQSWLRDSCHLTFLPEPFRTSTFGFYLQKNSPYTKLISNQIVRMVDSGLIDFWRKKWSPPGRRCEPEVMQGNRVITLSDTITAFYLASVGVGLAAIILAVERMICRNNL